MLLATIPSYESKEKEEKDDISVAKEQMDKMVKKELPSKRERNDFFKKT